MSSWLVLSLFLGIGMAEGVFGQERSSDPFSLPQGVRTRSGGGPGTPAKDLSSKPDVKSKEIPPPFLEVRAILVSDHLRLAFIDHQILTVGDLIHDEKVLEIQTDRVLLGKGDKKRSLILKQSPVLLTIEEVKGKGENR
jgi:hypothetical protein